MASKRNNNEKMVREKTTSLDSSSYFHVFNLHTSGMKRPNNKLIAFFVNHLPSELFDLSLLITLKSNNDKIPEILWRPQGHLTEVYCYRYDI